MVGVVGLPMECLKISEIKAVGAGGLLLAKLQDCKFEFVTNPVTKPRVGTELEVKLPFNYKIKFFVPSKQKPTEKEPVENLLQAILVEVEADEFSELKILENINKKCDEYVEKTGLEVTKTQGDVTEEYFRKLLKYKLGNKEQYKTIKKLDFKSSGVISEEYARNGIEHYFKDSNLKHEIVTFPQYDRDKTPTNPKVQISIKKR